MFGGREAETSMWAPPVEVRREGNRPKTTFKSKSSTRAWRSRERSDGRVLEVTIPVPQFRQKRRRIPIETQQGGGTQAAGVGAQTRVS